MDLQRERGERDEEKERKGKIERGKGERKRESKRDNYSNKVLSRSIDTHKRMTCMLCRP